MARQYRNYTDEDIVKYAAEATSMRDLLLKLGLKVAGGNYNNMRRNLQRLDLKCEHWTGQGWSKDKQTKDWSNYANISTIKPHLIKKKGHQCERCSREEWEDEQIPLEVDHIDGDKTNNEYDNLMLLCPNCHALTPTWRGRNARIPEEEKSPRKMNKCEVCNSPVYRESKKCKGCWLKSVRKE